MLSFAQKLYACHIISSDTKISVTRKGGRKGADSLLDHIIIVEQNADCLHVVLKLMEDNEYLCHIAKKIKGEIEGEEIVLYWICNNSCIVT